MTESRKKTMLTVAAGLVAASFLLDQFYYWILYPLFSGYLDFGWLGIAISARLGWPGILYTAQVGAAVVMLGLAARMKKDWRLMVGLFFAVIVVGDWAQYLANGGGLSDMFSSFDDLQYRFILVHGGWTEFPDFIFTLMSFAGSILPLVAISVPTHPSDHALSAPYPDPSLTPTYASGHGSSSPYSDPSGGPMSTSECIACGGTVSNRLSSCPHCGEPTDSGSSQMGSEGPLGPNEKFCPACDGRISLLSEVCPKCGISQMSTAGSLEKFCHACGTQIHTVAEMCPKCGVRQASSGGSGQVSNEGAEGIAKIASFCFPLIGLVLYFVWQDSKPQASKDVCHWALASVIIGFVFYFLFAVIGIGAGLSGF